MLTKEEVERIVDERIESVLNELTWSAERASGVGLFQRSVRAITAEGCERVRKSIMERWFHASRRSGKESA